MPLLHITIGIIILLLLIAVFKINAFISFIVVSIGVGLMEGMAPAKVLLSVQSGIGNTLGFLVLILGFGAMLGKLVADSGAAQQITNKMIAIFGLKYIQIALVITGFIVGIPMFYSVGFVILIPLIFTIASSTKLPLIYVGLPMLASLSVTHGYLPPHPSPTAIAVMFKADIGLTLLYGIIIAIPAITIAGPLFSRMVKNVKAHPLEEFVKSSTDVQKLPGTLNSILTALLPIFLISAATVCNAVITHDSIIKRTIVFIGNPVMAMLLSVFTAVFTLGIVQGRKMQAIMDSLAKSVSSITMILLIIAGSGALSQVLTDSGVSIYIANIVNHSGYSPLFIGWLLAATIRVCIGSATVAGLTAAGIILPVATGGTVNAELMVLSIGAGSLMLSHVNDGGFWMFKEYFNLSIRETFFTWSVMETLVSVIGLIGVLLLNLIL